MLRCGSPGSMAARFCSMVQASFFFQPSQLILQLPDLLEHPLALLHLCFLLGRFVTAEHLGQFIEEVLLPFADQVRMHPKLARQFIARFLFADGFQRHPRFEVGAEAASLSCHSWLLLGSVPAACSTYPAGSTGWFSALSGEERAERSQVIH